MKIVYPTEFILIDDDPINNSIGKMIVNMSYPTATVVVFTDPEKGLEYISNTYAGATASGAMLFLDINMPVLSGWDVLDRLALVPNLDTERLKIFMLSSSLDQTDQDMANANPLVSGYILKSLSREKLHRACAMHVPVYSE